MDEKKTALVLLNDLMFQVRIAEAAKPSGLKTIFFNAAETLLNTALQQRPALIVLDINYAASDPLGTIKRLKESAATREIPLLGYVSHVQVELRAAAVEAGCDVVLARSAFIQHLPELLAKYSAFEAKMGEGI